MIVIDFHNQFDADALALAIEFAGIDHVPAGSDHPHLIGSLKQMVESVKSLDQPGEGIAKVLGGNTARLLGL